MPTKLHIFLTCCLVFLFSTLFSLPILAQGQFNLRLQTGFPLEEFAQQNESIAFGVGGLLLIPTVAEESVVALGLDIDYMIYGSKTDDLVDNNGYSYSLITNNNILNGYFVARFKPRWESAFIYPYLDGLVGGRYIYTRTREEEDGETIDGYIEQDDFAFAYGGAGGLQISLNKTLKLDIRGVYTLGSKANFLGRNDIYPDPDFPSEWIYNTRRSKTDMFSVQLGLTFFID